MGTTEGEGALKADSCEYGCEGRCENLEHWKSRASYWHAVAETQLSLVEELRADHSKEAPDA